jgi:hypothetical protein
VGSQGDGVGVALDAVGRVRPLGTRADSLQLVVLLLVLVEAVTHPEDQYEDGEFPQDGDTEAAALPVVDLFFKGFQGLGGH